MTEAFAMHGVDTVLHMLERLQANDLAASAQGGLRGGLEAICEEARVLCPRDTGRLQASIHVRMTAGGGEVATDVPYAVSVELGTAYRPAQPFLFPALRTKQREAIDGVQSAVSRHLDRG